MEVPGRTKNVRKEPLSPAPTNKEFYYEEELPLEIIRDEFENIHKQ